MTRLRSALLVAAVGVTLVLAGCSGSDPEVAATGTATDNESAPSPSARRPQRSRLGRRAPREPAAAGG